MAEAGWLEPGHLWIGESSWRIWTDLAGGGWCNGVADCTGRVRGRKNYHPTWYLVSEMLNRRKLEEAVSVADLYGSAHRTCYNVKTLCSHWKNVTNHRMAVHVMSNKHLCRCSFPLSWLRLMTVVLMRRVLLNGAVKVFSLNAPVWLAWNWWNGSWRCVGPGGWMDGPCRDVHAACYVGVGDGCPHWKGICHGHEHENKQPKCVNQLDPC